jgi:hypothetical protein
LYAVGRIIQLGSGGTATTVVVAFGGYLQNFWDVPVAASS